jgi:phage-related protein
VKAYILKHIEGDIWKLRPLSNRIFFVAWDGRRFLMLHHFMKKTEKTPQKEIYAARRKLERAKNEVDRYEE